MVHPIPVPQAKYELLTDIRQPRWRAQVICLTLTFLAVSVLFITRTWIGIVILRSGDVDNYSEDLPNNAEITAWLQRARMYAESTKKNQDAYGNATANTTVSSDDKSAEQVIVCYYTIPRDMNTSGELRPSHIDPDICTHIIVGFASVVNCTLDLGANASLYTEVANLKSRAPGLKVLVSVGGMTELPNGFPEMVFNHTNRKKFIRSVLNITKEHNLDGLDLDWEFPDWMTSDSRQKIHFEQLVQELRKEFDRSGRKLLLTVAVAAPQAIVDSSYIVPSLAEQVDFVNLMAYDYHFYVWYYPLTGLNAPLYSLATEKGYLSTLNINYSAHYWLAAGMPRDKIVIGLSTYGHTYRLENSLNHGIQAPAIGFGELGDFGFVSYPAVCQFLKKGAWREFEKESRVPYAYKNHEWVSYDDTDSLYYKAEWIRDNKFKGAMILSLNVDDWNNTCDQNKTFPLTRSVLSVLKSKRSHGG